MTVATETPKTKRQLKTERRDAFYKGVNYVYGYATYRTQKLPTVTVAICPEMVEGQLYFGIGVTRCAPVDVFKNKLNKAEGRSRSTARARAVLTMGGKDILSKPDWSGKQNVLALRTHCHEAAIYVNDLSLSESLTDRVLNSLEYLTKKLLPNTTVEA